MFLIPAEWYVTLTTEEAKLSLLSETVTINGKTGHFLQAGSSEYRVRAHWLLRWVDNNTLWDALQGYRNIEVKQITTDKSTINLGEGLNLRNTYITVRSLIIRTEKI